MRPETQRAIIAKEAPAPQTQASKPQQRQTAAGRALLSLDGLRAFTGADEIFWQKLLEAVAALTSAECVLLLTQPLSDGENTPPWQTRLSFPANVRGFAGLDEKTVAQLAATAAKQGEVLAVPDANGAAGNGFVAARIDNSPTDQTVLALSLRQATQEHAFEALTYLKLVAAIPAARRNALAAERAKQDTERFATALDLMVLINAEKKFAAAAMRLCNEVAARHGCERASLGWLENNGYVRLQAISHSERFERKMNAVKALEAAMEEALDQDEEIIFPPAPEQKAITRDHAIFAKQENAGHIASVPIRVDEKSLGVLTLERAAKPFSGEELQALRLLCDQAARRLDDLKKQDRWFGARMAAGARRQLGKLVGVEHTGMKLAALAICVLLAVLIFGKKTYRVEAPFTLKSDVVAHLPAPFDGYIDEVSVRLGDAVPAGKTLVTLDTREFLLQEASALAEQARNLAEAEKAQSADNVADMRIAQAMADQAKARLDLARYHITHAKVTAPFDGVVIEGDLRERVGAPVRQGEVLLKVAKLNEFYVEAQVNERTIHEIRDGVPVQIAFTSRPKETFALRVERIEPVAEATEKGNTFTVRCVLTGQPPQSWWRPGMTGVSKIESSERSFLWILTHRTVDFLRLYFWW